MATYVLQYRENGVHWINVVDDDNFAVEFITKSGAIAIAKELSTCDHLPTISKAGNSTWRCIDSYGTNVWEE